MDLETSDTSDKDVVADTSLEKSSEDEEVKKSDTSAEEEEVDKAKMKSSSQNAAQSSSQKSLPGSQNGKGGAKVEKVNLSYSYNSGPDSLDANAAERIKSTTLRRQRKQVDRLVVGVPETSREKPVIIPEGEGTKFEDIPYIADQINNRAGDLLKLHRFLYGRPGAYAEVKKHLRQFSGFAFAVGSAEYERKKQALLKMETIGRDILCECVGVSKIGGKDAIAERLMDFLLKPSEDKVTGKLTSPDKRRSPSASPNKKVSPSKSAKEPSEPSQDEAISEEENDPEPSDYESEEEKRKSAKGKKKKSVAKKPKSSVKKVKEPAAKPAHAKKQKKPEQPEETSEEEAVKPKKRKKSEKSEETSGEEAVKPKKRKKSEHPEETSEEETVKPKKRSKPAPKKAATATDESVSDDTPAVKGKKNGVKKGQKKEVKSKATPAPKVPTFGRKKVPGKKKSSPVKNPEGSDNTSGQSEGEKDVEMEESVNDSDEISEADVRSFVMEKVEGADLAKVSMAMIIDEVKGRFTRIHECKTINLRNIINEILQSYNHIVLSMEKKWV